MSYTSYPDLLSHSFKPTSPPYTASPQYSASYIQHGEFFLITCGRLWIYTLILTSFISAYLAFPFLIPLYPTAHNSITPILAIA